MKNIGRIQGSEKQAKELIIGYDTVYVHSNIIKITEDKEGNPLDNLYEYDEIQYTKDEYIKFISEKNTQLESRVIDTQLALCEVYELLG